METKTKLMKLGGEWYHVTHEVKIEKAMKPCKECEAEKYPEEYRKFKKGKFGVSNICKECESKYFKELYLKKKNKNQTEECPST